MKIQLFSFFVIALAFMLMSDTASGTGNYMLYFQNANYMTHGDFVYCGAPDYGFTDQLTVAVWVKWTIDPHSFAVTPLNHEREGQYSTYIAYSSNNSGENGEFWLRDTKTANKFEFAVQNTIGTTATAISTISPEIGTWYFLVGVYDGSTVKLYVNGTEDGSAALTGNIKTNAGGTHRLNMGRLPWGYGFFVGYLDDARIWNSALTPPEITSQMVSASTVAPGTLKSYWNFEEGSGTIIDDSGPQNADGVFYTALIDVHNLTTTPYTISDNDKTWITDDWQNCILKTVSGAGIDQTNTVTTNTNVTCTLNSAWLTTPVLDPLSSETTNMSWFGVQKIGETSQWVAATSPLPVELIGFQGAAIQKNVLLTWRTACEINNYGFDIERRTVSWSSLWSTIGFVAGNGTSNSPHQYAYTDNSASNGAYAYRLKQRDRDGAVTYSAESVVRVTAVPAATMLHQNFPNPFNPSTVITYQLSTDSRVTLKVYDLLGREAASLVDTQQDAGIYSIVFNGEHLSTGVYFYRLEAAGFAEIKKFALMK